MNGARASARVNVGGGRKRRGWIVVVLVLLAVAGAGFAVLQYRRAGAARLREEAAVAAIRALGAEVEDQMVEVLPLGGLLPGSALAPYRLAIKLRNRAATDDQLAVLDDLDPDRVRSLDFINCKAGDATLARAGRFPKLALLGLGQGRNSDDKEWPKGPTGLLSEAGFGFLERLSELQTVGLHGPDVTDRALEHLAGAKHLRVLILYGSRVTGAGLTALGPKAELTTLKLGGTAINDDDLTALARFSALETLDLRDTRVTDAGLSRIGALPRLKRLSLEGCAVSDAAVDALIRSHPGLAVGRTISKTPAGTTK